MSAGADGTPGGTDRSSADRSAADEEPAARPTVDRARLDAVFGETLPATTSDEARGRGSRIDDDWWQEQRPPHHG